MCSHLPTAVIVSETRNINKGVENTYLLLADSASKERTSLKVSLLKEAGSPMREPAKAPVTALTIHEIGAIDR